MRFERDELQDMKNYDREIINHYYHDQDFQVQMDDKT